MPGNKQFDIDLAYGEQREGRLLEIMMLGGDKVEVKSDRLARKTGNVFVEFESRGKESGIITTTADWWVIELGEDVFIIMPTSRLREITNNKLKSRGYVRGGDGGTSKGVLIPIFEVL